MAEEKGIRIRTETSSMRTLTNDNAGRQWFSLVAPAYDSLVSPLFWPEWLQQQGLEQLDIRSKDRILDIGCGTGKTIESIDGGKTATHGLDVSRPQLETASKKEQLHDVQFVQGDAHRLPYTDAVFDGVVSIGSILYWADPVEVLQEAYRVTDVGGQILVMGFNRRPPSMWNPVENVQNTINATLFFRYSPRDAKTLFKRAGWTNVENRITGPEWSPDLVISTTAEKS